MRLSRKYAFYYSYEYWYLYHRYPLVLPYSSEYLQNESWLK
jgi:hypothetical protein